MTTYDRRIIQADPRDAAPGLRGVLRWLWDGRWIIAAALALSALSGTLYLRHMTQPLYRASTHVMLEIGAAPIIDLQSVTTGLSLSESRTINSEIEVLTSIRLLGQVVDDMRLTEDADFNPYIGATGTAASGRGWFGRRPDADPIAPDAIWADTVQALRRDLRVTNLPDTTVFNVSFENPDPQKAAQIANRIAQTYVADQIALQLESTQAATRWLSGRVAELKSTLEAGEREINQVRGEIGLTSADRPLALEARLKVLRDRRVRLEDALAGLAADETDRRSALLRQRAEIDATIAEAELEVSRQNADAIRIEQLTRDVEASRVLYEHFLARLKESAAQEGVHQPRSRILSQALVPKEPSAPNSGLILSMWIIFGALLGVALAYARVTLSDRITAPDALEDLTGHKILGQIPKTTARTPTGLIRDLGEHHASELAESLRNLRTSLLLSRADTPPQVIAIASSLPGEGKTTLSMALAQSLQGTGRKTLLIEGDLRRRTLTQTATSADPTATGLQAVLAGTLGLAEVVRHDPLLGADVLPAETMGDNAADLLASKAFGSLVQSARETYDVVLIDTPPVLIVPDARLIAQHVDTTLFVVSWGRTTKRQVRDALGWFEKSNHRIGGIALNRIDTKRMARMGHGGNYSRYGSGYYASSPNRRRSFSR